MNNNPAGTPTPEDLELEKVLGDLPQKVYDLKRVPPKLAPLKLPQNVTPEAALARVLRLVSVGSKRFLTNKVDRSVTGLVARQQCVGPLQLPVADVAVIAQRRALSASPLRSSPAPRAIDAAEAHLPFSGPLLLSIPPDSGPAAPLPLRSYFGTTGGACAVGEQPIKGLVRPPGHLSTALAPLTCGSWLSR